MSKRIFKVNFQKIFSVFLCAVLSFSLLCINVSAFTFDGENRSIKDIYSDWFKSTNDFISGNSSFEQWRNANIRFQTDLIGSNLFPGTETELDRYIDEFEDKIHTAVEGSDNKVDDSVLNIFDKTLETIGVFDFREQFENWYQDKYGKEYHGKPFDHEFSDIPTSSYNYYIYSHSQGYEYKLFFSYSGKPIKVSETSGGLQYFSGFQLGTITYRKYTRTQYADGQWGEWVKGDEYTGTTSAKYYLNVEGNQTVDSTNLPLQYGDDIKGGEPVTDWDNELGGELVAPSITLPELKDLLIDLDNDLQNSVPSDDSSLKKIELKITQLINKTHNDFSKVIDVLNKILAKLTDFFNTFVDIFSNFFEKLGEFFQSIFVPSDDYISSSMFDIKAEFDEAFSFAGDLRVIVDNCINAYKSGGTRAPDIEISVDGYGSPRKLDFSIFDKSISLVRSVLCAICYASFAFNTYRRIPMYISGGGER